jgi:hypothetical protein
MLIVSLKKATTEFSKKPFNFIWPAIVYLALQTLVLLAVLGLFIIYFLIASVLNISTGIDEMQTIIAVGAAIVVFLFLSGGLNAGLAKGFSNALEGNKISLADFYRHAMERSATMFSLMLIRDLIYVLVVGWVIGAFVYFKLDQYQYVDFIVGAYVFFATFIVHFLFTPALVSAGAMNTSLFRSLKNGFQLIRKKHIMIIGLFILFSFVWIFNFIPIIQLISFFALYPIVYSAIIILLKENTR